MTWASVCSRGLIPNCGNLLTKKTPKYRIWMEEDTSQFFDLNRTLYEYNSWLWFLCNYMDLNMLLKMEHFESLEFACEHVCNSEYWIRMWIWMWLLMWIRSPYETHTNKHPFIWWTTFVRIPGSREFMNMNFEFVNLWNLVIMPWVASITALVIS